MRESHIKHVRLISLTHTLTLRSIIPPQAAETDSERRTQRHGLVAVGFGSEVLLTGLDHGGTEI